jgi:hypothetical protein
MPPCCDCGRPVAAWLGPVDAKNARCTTCWDALYAAQARLHERAWLVLLVLAAALLALALATLGR